MDGTILTSQYLKLMVLSKATSLKIKNQIMPILLQINSVVNSGSTGRIAEEIGKLAIVNGWESNIAFGRNVSTSKSKLIKIGCSWDAFIHGALTRLFDIHGLASMRATRRLLNRIEEIKPDIIHLHNIHGYYLNYPILFKYLLSIDIPVIWTFHDCWPITGHCAYFDRVGCIKWQNGCSSCPQKNTYPKSLLFDRSKMNYLDKQDAFNSLNNLTLVPVSDWLSDILKSSFLKKHPINRIYNGVDTSIFKPVGGLNISINGQINNRFTILGVASPWSSRKGLDDFIKLYKKLDQDKYCIILVGLSDNQKKTLPAGIIGLTRTENVQELAQIYSAADVFVNPTYEDNFPTTNIEALACGTPIITYRTGGSPEAVTPDTGFVVEQGSLEGLLEAISIIIKKGKLAYTDACRQRALDNFKKEDRYKEYIDLYNQLLKDK